MKKYNLKPITIILILIILVGKIGFTQDKPQNIIKSNDDIEKLNKKELQVYIDELHVNIHEFEEFITDYQQKQQKEVKNLNKTISDSDKEFKKIDSLLQLKNIELIEKKDSLKRVIPLLKYCEIYNYLDSLNKYLHQSNSFDTIINLKDLSIHPEGYYWGEELYTGYVQDSTCNGPDVIQQLGYIQNGVKDGFWFVFDIYGFEFTIYDMDFKDVLDIKIGCSDGLDYWKEIYQIFTKTKDIVTFTYCIDEFNQKFDKVGGIEYYTLDGFKKNGLYVKNDFSNKIEIGYYKDDMKDSTWIYQYIRELPKQMEISDWMKPMKISETNETKIENYKNGLKNGKQEEYNNGLIRIRENYKNDKLDGNEEIYDDKGNFERVTKYSNGEKIN